GDIGSMPSHGSDSEPHYQSQLVCCGAPSESLACRQTASIPAERGAMCARYELRVFCGSDAGGKTLNEIDKSYGVSDPKNLGVEKPYRSRHVFSRRRRRCRPEGLSAACTFSSGRARRESPGASD